MSKSLYRKWLSRQTNFIYESVQRLITNSAWLNNLNHNESSTQSNEYHLCSIQRGLLFIHSQAISIGKADFGGPFCFVRYRVTSQWGARIYRTNINKQSGYLTIKNKSTTPKSKLPHFWQYSHGLFSSLFPFSQIKTIDTFHRCDFSHTGWFNTVQILIWVSFWSGNNS